LEELRDARLAPIVNFKGRPNLSGQSEDASEDESENIGE
jgi:hypothetical protein